MRLGSQSEVLIPMPSQSLHCRLLVSRHSNPANHMSLVSMVWCHCPQLVDDGRWSEIRVGIRDGGKAQVCCDA